jgi:hypothetical protein
MPRFDSVLAPQITANATLANAPQNEASPPAAVSAGACPSSLNPELRFP